MIDWDKFAKEEQARLEKEMKLGDIVEFSRDIPSIKAQLFGTAKITILKSHLGPSEYFTIQILTLFPNSKFGFDYNTELPLTKKDWIGEFMGMFRSTHTYCNWNCFCAKFP